MFRILFFALSLFWATTNLHAQQTYPIYVTPQLTPPYSLVLSDYTQPGSQRLVVTINVRDITVTNLPVRLHLKMENMSGVTIETIPTAPVTPIFLTGGEYSTLFGDDMREYFNINNLQFSGFSKDEYRRTGQLPEGFWRFTVEVRHFATGRLISNRGTAMAWMALGKPPLLKLPDNNAELGQIMGMPLTFSWIPQNVGIPGVTPQYTFEMWEMRVPGINPNVVAASMPVFYSTTQMHTSLVIHPATLMLEPGMNYAWRVTASDVMDRVPFAQNGRSEVRSFIYQCRCDSITDFKVERDGKRVTYRWNPAKDHTSYNIEMENPVSGWSKTDKVYDNKYPFNSDPDKTYRLRVQAICQNNEMNPSEFSAWKSVTIPAERPLMVGGAECGKEYPDVPLTNFTLKDLQPGDTIITRRGDSRFIIQSVVPQGNGVYDGKLLSWWEFAGIKVPCEYWGLKVNTDNQIVYMARMESIKDSTFLVNVDAVKESVEKIKDAVTTLIPVILDFIIPENPEYHYDAESGTLTIMDENNNPQVIDFPKTENGTVNFPVLLEDDNGNIYKLDKSEENNGQPVMSIVSSSTTAITRLPAYIGYAQGIVQNEPKAYLCNTQNIAEIEEIFDKFKKEQTNCWGGVYSSCDVNIQEGDRIALFWKNVEKDTDGIKFSRSKLSTEDFYVRLNGQRFKGEGEYFYAEDLKDGNNICELVVENTQTKKSKVVALFSITTGETKKTDLRIRVERAIPGNPHRIDHYKDGDFIATSSDIPLKIDSTLIFRVDKIVGNDTIIYSNDDTQWYRNNDFIAKGAVLQHQVTGDYSIKAITSNNDTIFLSIRPEAPMVIDGRIRLDYSRVSTNRNDTVLSRRLFNAAYTRCNRNDVGNFIRNAPSEVVVYTERDANRLLRGEATIASKLKDDTYKYLDLDSIQLDSDNAIKNETRLISRITKEDENDLKKSVKDGRATQKTEVLLRRIGRLSVANRDSLQAMINRKDTTYMAMLNTIRYEITEEDDISEWIIFHTSSIISFRVNLNGEIGGNTTENEFTRTMAHELLHHWWARSEPFKSLKWMIIREKAGVNGYNLADGLSSEDPVNSNRNCSAGYSHERHNPEHSKVCRDQNNY